MKRAKVVPFYIESVNGHDTEFLKQGKVLQDEVEEHLEKDEWVSLEKPNGSTELLTKDDIPKAEAQTGTETPKDQPTKEEWEKVLKGEKIDKDKPKPVEKSKQQKEWAEKFEKVKSATATTKAKGG